MKIRKDVIAFAVGLLGGRNTCARVYDGHGRVGKHRPGGIGHCAVNRGCGSLRVRSNCQSQGTRYQQQAYGKEWDARLNVASKSVVQCAPARREPESQQAMRPGTADDVLEAVLAGGCEGKL